LADRALGCWYYRVFGFFGGSNRKSEEHLRRSFMYDLSDFASLYFLVETLIDMKRMSEAKAILDCFIVVFFDPVWVVEDCEFKAKVQ